MNIPTNHDLQEALRLRFRERAHGWFGGDVLLLGHSPTIRRLGMALERAPEDWPLVIVAEAGSGVANWLRALHIAATEEPQPILFLHARQWLRGQQETEAPAVSGQCPMSGPVMPRLDGETLAFSRLDLLDSEQLVALRQSLKTPRRVIASARPKVISPRAINSRAVKSSRRQTSPADRYVRAGFATEIRLPPLRERPEDVPPLLRYFLQRFGFPQPIELSPAVFDRCLAYPWPGNEKELSKFVARLVAEVGRKKVGLEQIATLAPQILNFPTSSLHPAVQRAVLFINSNFDAPLSLAEVAEAAFTSTSHLSYLFKSELQTRFGSLLSQVRVRHAQRMIRAYPDRSLEFLALRCGFSSLRQMERHFQKQVRLSPSVYRQMI